MKRLTFVLIAFGLSFQPLTLFSQEYDLVILNGRVMDPETNLDAVRNVGITGGKIVAVTEEPIQGETTIDATNHVVAPGFVDTHNHNVLTPFGRKLALRDGITTQLELEAGVMPVGKWYESMEGKSQINFGATASILGARETVFNPRFKSVNGATINDLQSAEQTGSDMQWSSRVANEDEINQILELIEEGLKQGALGVGHVPGYMSESVTAQECYGAQVLAAKYGRFVSMHGRFSSQQPPVTGILAIEEQLGAVAAEGGGLIVCHMTAQTLGLTSQALRLIDSAHDRGHAVIAEIYGYTYGSTIVAADYLRPDNYQNNMGRTYSDIINLETMEPLTKETYEQLVETAPSTKVTFENATKADLYLALAHPTTIIGSDAFTYLLKEDGSVAEAWDTPYDAVNGHPRAAGTHARILRLVREENLMPLMLAISKMTYMPARFLQENGVPQMAYKGRIQAGADADITIFDPDTVKDEATPAAAGLPSSGIPYVIVSGTVVVEDSKVLKDVSPGQPVRLPVQQ